MSATLIAALCFTGVLLVTTAYFLMGGAPLLTLKHDTPKDARFVRSFFNVYYRAAMLIASATAVSYALAGRLAFATGAAALALLATLLRRTIISKMDSLGARIEGGETSAIPAFRRLHAAAILINLAQLALIVWSLISVSLEFRSAPIALHVQAPGVRPAASLLQASNASPARRQRLSSLLDPSRFRLARKKPWTACDVLRAPQQNRE